MGGGPSGGTAPLRPDLAIPVAGAPSPVLSGLFAGHEPAFDRARRRSAWVVAAAAGLLVAGQFAVVDPLREPVTALGVVLAACASVWLASLMVLERRQRDFARTWLAARTASLRTSEFEIVRCTAGDRAYDLNDAESTAELLRSSAADARLVLEFAYPPANLERAHRRMREVQIRAVLRGRSRARIRFPAARYGLDATGRRTFWLLGVPAVVTAAAPAGPAAARGGTGSTDRPAAAPPAGERPPGTT
ncbi:hypothetical protein [Actinophytocola xanthii]|uniref:hypothetical protein n=1 Tax=Actinophytocola xanthii TaxID=1912961 RepID=UPI0011776DA6|nr:hypothetical protein [Actinophytocola xanthii]